MHDIPVRSLVPLILLTTFLASPSAQAQVTIQPKMGQPIDGLTPDELLRFQAGKAEFEHFFTEAEGLGPIMNDDSCSSCHSLPATGGAGVLFVTRFGLSDKGSPFDPLNALGGTLLQALSIDPGCSETVPTIANITAQRVTPSIFGSGLVEAIPDADILALESPGGGMAHFVPLLENPSGPLRVGRFGWKAQIATILTFSGDAAQAEMGITNELLPAENAPNGNTALLATCDGVSDPEDLPDAQGFTFVDRITDFQRFLAPPPQTPRSGMTGEAVFNSVGCASCHHDTFTSGPAPEAALSNRELHPYSDFLLHDMGILGDGIVDGAASEVQMRTPSLWGVRIRRPLLHDGRVFALDLEQAIDECVSWHGGEAAPVAAAYAALPSADKAALIAFIDSLGRLEFDMNGDGIVSDLDIVPFLDCFTGSGAASVSPDDPCAVSDIDQDGDVDLVDADFFVQAFEGSLGDCDASGIPDILEILQGTLPDANGNGVPDGCEAVTFLRSDCNEDGGQDLGDAIFGLSVLFSGEAPPSCLDACDVNDDGSFDISDPVYQLAYLFTSGPAIPAPSLECGADPTPSGLSCAGQASCP